MSVKKTNKIAKRIYINDVLQFSKKNFGGRGGHRIGRIGRHYLWMVPKGFGIHHHIKFIVIINCLHFTRRETFVPHKCVQILIPAAFHPDQPNYLESYAGSLTGILWICAMKKDCKVSLAPRWAIALNVWSPPAILCSIGWHFDKKAAPVNLVYYAIVHLNLDSLKFQCDAHSM